MPRLRGARPSLRHRLAAARPHRIIGATPPQIIWLPAILSMWDNDVDGDCVTAEEAFKNGCDPGVFITDATVVTWATNGGFLNGADLTTVMDAMQTGGFQQDGKVYDDGEPSAIDWTTNDILLNAIAQGPVKIGVAADQLDNAVGPDDPPPSGWFGTGFTTDSNEDHCVSLCGYGSIAWLSAQIMAKYSASVPLPANVDGTQPGLGLFTWKSVGVIDVPSMLAITGEAWLRTPNTIVVAQS